MNQSQHCAGREANVFETEPDIQQHTDRGNDNCHSRVRAHLGADCRADIFCHKLLGHAELVLHICLERLTFRQIQCLRLKYDLVRAFYSLYLNIVISRDILKLRDHPAVDLLESIFPVKCHGSRSTAREVKAVIHCPHASGLIDSHSHKSADAQQYGNDEEHFSLTKEVNGFSRLFHTAVYFRSTDTDGIERVHDQSCHHKRRKHGYHDTKSQCLGKSFHRAAAAQPEHCRRDQGRDVAVQNGGHRLVKTSF